MQLVFWNKIAIFLLFSVLTILDHDIQTEIYLQNQVVATFKYRI